MIDCIFYIYMRICVGTGIERINNSIKRGLCVVSHAKLYSSIEFERKGCNHPSIGQTSRLLLYGDNVITFLSRTWPMSRYRHIGIGGCTRRKYARNAKSFVTRARKERGPRSGFRSWHFALTLAWKINFTGEKLESERCCTDRLNVVRGNYMLKYVDVLIYKCMRVCMYVYMNSKDRRSLKKNIFVIPRS